MAKKFKKVPPEVPVTELTPLNITCGSTKCCENLHCFRMAKSHIEKHGKTGVCKECGADLVDWDRIHRNDISDAKFTFHSMKFELIRHVFWHAKIESEAISLALTRGKSELKAHVEKIIRQKISGPKNAWDGRQTPLSGHEIVNYAQHATATCCRRCLKYWHNIPEDTQLTQEQIEFCSELAMLYIEERVPDLTDEGIQAN